MMIGLTACGRLKNACGSSANQKKDVLVLAEVPQIEKRTFWCLRKFRKSKRGHFGACGNSANQKEDVLAFAEVPQIEKRTFWCLRKFRKSKKALLGVCGVPANRKKHFWAFAGFPQAKKKRFGICGTPASTVFFILMLGRRSARSLYERYTALRQRISS